MINVLIFDYCSECTSTLAKLGTRHNKIEEFDSESLAWKRAKVLVDAGLSLMIEKSENDPVKTHNMYDYIFFVDKHGKRFRQR